MKPKRFHSHNAWIYNYEDQTEFVSYSTVMMIKKDGVWFMNREHYSRSTTRQVNRFIEEYGIDREKCVLIDEHTIAGMAHKD